MYTKAMAEMLRASFSLASQREIAAFRGAFQIRPKEEISTTSQFTLSPCLASLTAELGVQGMCFDICVFDLDKQRKLFMILRTDPVHCNYYNTASHRTFAIIVT
jgi:hypothetical protein